VLKFERKFRRLKVKCGPVVAYNNNGNHTLTQ
jgi:hypothetical protein